MGAGGTRAGTGPPDPLPSLEPGHLYSAVGSTGLSRPGQSPGWLPWAQRPVVFPLTDCTPQTEAAGSGDKVTPAGGGGQAGQCGPLNDPCQNPPQGGGLSDPLGAVSWVSSARRPQVEKGRAGRT